MEPDVKPSQRRGIMNFSEKKTCLKITEIPEKKLCVGRRWITDSNAEMRKISKKKKRKQGRKVNEEIEN